MMKQFEYNRLLSYSMNPKKDDYNLPSIHITEPDEQLILRIVTFFYYGSELIYPAKSYFVAIIYAKLLEKYFEEPFYESLSNSNLLPDDKYFVPYTKATHIYDKVLEKIGNPLSYPSTQKTISYFKEEYLIGTNNKPYKQM